MARRSFAGKPEWFEVEAGQVFEVQRHGPVGSHWIVLDPRYDGAGTARMGRLNGAGYLTDERDTVWWAELFEDSKLIGSRSLPAPASSPAHPESEGGRK